MALGESVNPSFSFLNLIRSESLSTDQRRANLAERRRVPKIEGSSLSLKSVWPPSLRLSVFEILCPRCNSCVLSIPLPVRMRTQK